MCRVEIIYIPPLHSPFEILIYVRDSRSLIRNRNRIIIGIDRIYCMISTITRIMRHKKVENVPIMVEVVRNAGVLQISKQGHVCLQRHLYSIQRNQYELNTCYCSGRWSHPVHYFSIRKRFLNVITFKDVLVSVIE